MFAALSIGILKGPLDWLALKCSLTVLLLLTTHEHCVALLQDESWVDAYHPEAGEREEENIIIDIAKISRVNTPHLVMSFLAEVVKVSLARTLGLTTVHAWYTTGRPARVGLPSWGRGCSEVVEVLGGRAWWAGEVGGVGAKGGSVALV